MLHTLSIKNFTVFSEAHFEFSPGLNVIIGDNGTGKSHLLYLGYVIESVLHDYLLQSSWDKELWQRGLADKLKMVFKPEKLGRLCRLQKRQRAEIKMVSSVVGQSVPKCTTITTAFSFFVTAKKKVKMAQSPSVSRQGIPKPVFFPTKEVLSFYPEARDLGLSNAIYDDLCQALSAKGKRLKKVAKLVAPLEEILQGKVVMNFDHFYLQSAELGKMEISLVPEGLRKIAMLSYLLSNGGLAKGSTLFWDEPEASLNPRLRVKLVDTLVALVKAGVQIILATQDLFLMKELSLRVEAGETQAHFFELQADTQVVQGDNLDDLFRIVALEAALDQYDREQDIVYQAISQ